MSSSASSSVSALAVIDLSSMKQKSSTFFVACGPWAQASNHCSRCNAVSLRQASACFDALFADFTIDADEITQCCDLLWHPCLHECL
eukprot:1888661-Karenia_brevis.AAC.1